MAAAASMSNYMGVIASANAMSESAPRKRPLTSERESVSHVKKQVPFPAPKADASSSSFLKLQAVRR